MPDHPTPEAVTPSDDTPLTEQEQRDATGLPGTFVQRDSTDLYIDKGPKGGDVLVPPRQNAPLLYDTTGRPELSNGMKRLLRALLPPEVQAELAALTGVNVTIPRETAIVRAVKRAIERYKDRDKQAWDITCARVLDGRSWAQVSTEFKVSIVVARQAVERCAAYLSGAVEHAVDDVAADAVEVRVLDRIVPDTRDDEEVDMHRLAMLDAIFPRP